MTDKKHSEDCGLKRLVEKYRQEFQQPENTSHYSEQDYAAAEKRYIYHRLNNG